MKKPEKLYTLHGEVTPTDRRVLLYSFNGFLDAGGACRLAVDTIIENLEHRLIATFDADELLDFRARRPRMMYSIDHFVSAEIPTVTLHEVIDAEGQPFLLLAGPEPDFQWGSFIAAVHQLVDEFDVALSVALSAIPWPAPHTRPVGVTVHGSEPELLRLHESPLGDIEVPGHVGGMIELQLAESGHPSMGVSVHIPHYLVQFEYPRAAMKVIATAAEVSGLVIPFEELEPAALTAEAEIASQLEGNDEFISVVSALEQQYDQAAAAHAQGISSLAPGGNIPTGEEIAASVEQFLAQMDADQEESKDD